MIIDRLKIIFLTSDVPAFLLLGEALALAHVVQEVEEKVDIVGTLRQNLLLIKNIITCFAAFGSYPNHIEKDYLKVKYMEKG